MTALVLDPRWPEMVPLAVAGRIRGPVTFTDDVPAPVRALFAQVPQDSWDGGWLVTCDMTLVDALSTHHDEVILAPSLDDPVRQAVSAMHQARQRGEWERSMTHASLVPYLLEEAGEVAEVIGSNGDAELDNDELKNELADIFLQVLFHAELAKERGAFGFEEVVLAFVDKLKSRAPYLFDGSTGMVDVATQDRLWAEGKARERRR